MSDDREILRAWLGLLNASNTVKKEVDARMRRRFGLSLSRFDVLAALDRAEPNGLSGGGLSALLKVTEGNTTQITAPLIKDGFVSRSVSVDDGRVAIFRLTAKGERLFAEMAAANRHWVSGAFSGMSSTQISTLRRLLALLKPPAASIEDIAA